MKKWLKQVMPAPQALRDSPHLGIFGTLLHDPNLWHLNRRSVAGAFAIGLFVMYLPPLGQSLIAAALAIGTRVNLPVAVGVTWISNPLTIPPMFYAAYVLGSWLLGQTARGFESSFWLDWHNWFGVLAPLLIGCLVCGIACSALGYVGIHALWRWRVARQVERRRAGRQARAASRLRTPSSSRHT